MSAQKRLSWGKWAGNIETFTSDINNDVDKTADVLSQAGHLDCLQWLMQLQESQVYPRSGRFSCLAKCRGICHPVKYAYASVSSGSSQPGWLKGPLFDHGYSSVDFLVFTWFGVSSEPRHCLIWSIAVIVYRILNVCDFRRVPHRSYWGSLSSWLHVRKRQGVLMLYFQSGQTHWRLGQAWYPERASLHSLGSIIDDKRSNGKDWRGFNFNCRVFSNSALRAVLRTVLVNCMNF